MDDCEFALDKTITANTFVPTLLAEGAIRNNIKFVHISSGCIYHYDYSKPKPIGENKVPDFVELYYSRTKIYTERILEILSKKYNILIARIRIPLDDRPHSKNVLTKLIQFKKIVDVPNSVTYIPDFITILKHLLKIDARGIYNIVNRGSLKYPDLLKVYQKYVPDFQYKVIDYKKLNLVRTNLVLSTRKLESTGLRLRTTKEILEECVKNYLKN